MAIKWDETNYLNQASLSTGNGANRTIVLNISPYKTGILPKILF